MGVGYFSSQPLEIYLYALLSHLKRGDFGAEALRRGWPYFSWRFWRENLEMWGRVCKHMSLRIFGYLCFWERDIFVRISVVERGILCCGIISFFHGDFWKWIGFEGCISSLDLSSLLFPSFFDSTFVGHEVWIEYFSYFMSLIDYGSIYILSLFIISVLFISMVILKFWVFVCKNWHVFS